MMKHTSLKYFLLLLINPIAPLLTAQVDLSEDTHSKPSEIVHRHMLNHPNENYVVQSDRDLYFSGSELWYSVWSLDDQTLGPFSYSRIVYVELMDKYGKSWEQQVLKLDKCKASGRIILSDNLTSGMYYLRVYSNLQRNYGEYLFGIKLIQVINPSKPPVMTSDTMRSKPLVSIFPEGQRLLNGIINKLVVKATYPNGLYAGLTDGFLIKQPDDTVAQLDFPIPGLGHCSFHADTSHTYYLDLPGIGLLPLEIQDHGLTLSIKEAAGRLTLRILGKGLPDREDHYLIGKTRGHVFLERALEQGLEEVEFPRASLPGGLLEFSILNSALEEYCQRLYYNNISQAPLSSGLEFQKSSFQKGETIGMEILLPEERTFPMLSLSVTRDIFVYPSPNQRFKSRVDLHPYLNDWDEFGQLTPAIPADSFTGILDIYLITRKSSRFAWRNLSQGIPEVLEFRPEVDVKRVTGYGFNPANNQRINNDRLLLFFIGKEASILQSRTDHEGRFSFDYPVHKTGKSEFVLQSFGHNEALEISLDWPFHQSFHAYNLDFFHFDTSRFEEFDRAYVYASLEQMYRDMDKPIQNPEKKAIAFYGLPDARKQLEDYLSMRNMEEVFKEIVPGERLRNRDNAYTLQIYHRDKYVLLGDHPLILFNGAPVLSLKEVLGMPVSRVDFVDMVRQQYMIQNQVFNGIINVVAKDLNLQLKIPPNAFRTTLEVFTDQCRFSNSRESSEVRIPDLNATLYWNPDLSFEGNTGHIAFKAGNISGRYQVLLRGIDADGEVLELIKYITIQD